MAQFLKAKFLSQALEWKSRFPATEFYTGLRYEPFIYEQARKVFPNYSKLYPDNKDFTEKIVRDLRNKDTQLLKAINPDQITPEIEALNSQFQTEARLEQQVVAQTNPQEVSQPFSLLSPSVPRVSFPAGLPPTEEKSTMVSQIEQAHKPPKTTFRAPKPPSSFVNTAKNFGSRAGIFFQRNVGKYLTFGRLATFASGGIGAIAGFGIGGSPGALFGGALGLTAPSYLKARGTSDLRRLGGGVINASSRLSNQISGPRFRIPSTGKGKLAWALFGAFFLLVFVGGIIGGLTGKIPTLEAPGLPPGTGGSANLAISLAGPSGCTDICRADNNQEINYEISLVYNGAGSADVEVSGKIPDGVNLSKADAEKWNLSPGNFSQVIPDLATKEIKKLSLTFKPDSRTDFWTAHLVTAKMVRTNLPSAEACHTKYASVIAKNPDNINFGDPVCNFTKDDLYLMLKQQDPDNADFWYFKVVPCESSYNPNEFFRCDSAGRCTPDPAGAWGLFQMGRGKNGIYDHGDVAWQSQISNAINYNITKIQSSGLGISSYWQCAG